MATIFKTGQRLWLLVQGIRVVARVQSHDQDSIVVSPGPGLILERGAVVPVGCPTPGGFALYWMQVLTPPNALGRHAVLRRNPNAGGNFNRRGWRVNVSVVATIRRTGAPHFVESRVANLSMEGAFVVSAANMCAGDIIDLRMFLPDTTPCQLTARVCRLAPVAMVSATGLPADQGICGAGLIFLEVPRETRGVLMRYLWRTIRELHGVKMT